MHTYTDTVNSSRPNTICVVPWVYRRNIGNLLRVYASTENWKLFPMTHICDIRPRCVFPTYVKRFSGRVHVPASLVPGLGRVGVSSPDLDTNPLLRCHSTNWSGPRPCVRAGKDKLRYVHTDHYNANGSDGIVTWYIKWQEVCIIQMYVWATEKRMFYPMYFYADCDDINTLKI